MTSQATLPVTGGSGNNVTVHDDGSGNLTQAVALTYGAAGAAQVSVTTGAPLPVVDSAAATALATIATNTTPIVGCSTYSAQGGTGNALLTATAVAVKASAGSIEGFDFVNLGSSAAWVQIFDALVGGVTLGTTIPKLSKWVPAGGSWEEKFGGDAKIAFATGITVAATTTPTGSAAPATGINANINYK